MTNYFKYRIFETLPGVLVWGVLIIITVLSWVRPLWVIYFIILFDLYWVFRVVYFQIYLLLSWRSYKQALATNWAVRLQTLTVPWGHYVHCVFLPVYNEDENVVRATLLAIINSTLDSKKIIIVLAGEERQRAHFESFAEKFRVEFEHSLYSFIITLHPQAAADEIPGKGSNLHYAGGEAQKWLDARGISYDRVIVSAFDIDTIAHPAYFSYLTFLYATTPNPIRASFQPVALYNNNIWESSAPLRVMAFGTTFWLLFALARPEILGTFSSHSMSFRALVDVDFWQKDIVSEDSRIFLQCFFKYGGDYRVVPMYLPVSMDTVSDPSYWNSLKNLYKQQRRWAWGVEHVPYLLWNILRHPEISWYKKFARLWNQWEGKFSWCTTSIFILVFGRLPLWVAGDTVRATVIFQNTPHILEWLMTISMLGIISSMVFSLRLLPPPPQHLKKRVWLYMIAQWILVPVSLVFFSAIPAIDATTRLLFGRYLGFNVSQKRRPLLFASDRPKTI